MNIYIHIYTHIYIYYANIKCTYIGVEMYVCVRELSCDDFTGFLARLLKPKNVPNMLGFRAWGFVFGSFDSLRGNS